MELADVADTDSVDSKEEQAVDNTCYMKLASMLQPFIIIFFWTVLLYGTSNFHEFRYI